MLSAGLAVEPPHRVGHGLGSSLGAGLSAGLGAALGAGLGPPSHHPMLQAFTSGEFLRPMPPHRPGEPGPGAAMFSPPDLRFWLHQQHQQQQHHLARYAAASQSVSHHRLPPQSPTSSPQAAPPPAPPPAPSPAPVNLSAGHKEDKERSVQAHAHSSAAMSYHYPHYPMAAPMFPPAPYSPYGARLPPPADAHAPAAYSPPAGSPAPLPPPSHPAPKPAVASKTFKVPVPAGPPSGGKDSSKHRATTHAAKQPPLSSTSTSMLPPLASSTPIMTTTATPHHSLHAAPTAQDYLHPAPAAAPAPATTLPQFWKGSFIRLASGELKRVQETKAEDFVASAERNPTLRADPATVVRIQSALSCRVTIALSVGGSESEIETTSEHPFCVYGNGWASCSPERSLQLLGLNCRTLQVGDVVVSLTHRQQPQQQQQPKAPQRSQASTGARGGRGKKQQAVNLPPPTGHPRAQHLPGPGPAPGPASTPTADSSAASMAGKKRRWSAPDQLAAAAAEEAQAAAQAAMPSKLARVPE